MPQQDLAAANFRQLGVGSGAVQDPRARAGFTMADAAAGRHRTGARKTLLPADTPADLLPLGARRRIPT